MIPPSHTIAMIGAGGGMLIAAIVGPLILMVVLAPPAILFDCLLLYTAGNKEIALRRVRWAGPVVIIEAIAIATYLI